MKEPLSPIMQLGVAFLLLILLAIAACFVCADSAKASDLGTRSELQVALYSRMAYDSTNTRYSPTMIRGFLDEANQFVQSYCKCNIEMDTVSMNPNSLFVPVPSAAARNGILNIQKIKNGKAVNLIKRPVTDFGKTELPSELVFAVVGDSIRLERLPESSTLLYVTYWKIQGAMAADTTDVLVPPQYRRLIVDYAYGLYMQARGDYQTKQAIEQAILNEIYMMGAEPSQEIQNYGIDSAQ